MLLHLEIALHYMAITPGIAWRLLHASHPCLLHATKQIDLYDNKYMASEMLAAIRRKGKPHFVAKFEEGELDYMPVGGNDLDLVIIQGCVGGVDDAWAWVKPFAHSDAFKSGRLYDHQYEYWQNAHDPLQYTSAGRGYAGLPTKSNGLPFPLEQQIIDTSHNPGRRILRQGYVEAVGAVMWLGKQFWPLTGASKQGVLGADWLRCEQLPQGVLRVQAADAPFTTAEGASGELQDRLRALLFPEAAHGTSLIVVMPEL